MNHHDFKFSTLRILLTAPTGYKQVRYLERIHVVNGAMAHNRRMAEIVCFLHHGQAATDCWLFKLSGVRDMCKLQVYRQ